MYARALHLHVGAISDGSVGQGERGGRGVGRGHGSLEREREAVKKDTDMFNSIRQSNCDQKELVQWSNYTNT